MKKDIIIILLIYLLISGFPIEGYTVSSYHLTNDELSRSLLLDWSAIVIPCLVTIAGLIITNRNTKKGFENTLKQKNNDQKREVYTLAYIDVDELVTLNYNVFDKDHFDRIVSHKAKIKLCGSKAVIKCYEDIFNYCQKIIIPYWKWISENYPEDYNNYDSGESYNAINFSEQDYLQFEQNRKQYEKEHLPDRKEIDEKVKALLNAMRDDLGNTILM